MSSSEDKPNQDRGAGGARVGEIPQSQALAEASTDSLTEVMSRDPEGYSRQDRDVIVAALRAQRARLAASEAAAGPKAPRAAAGPKIPLSSKATVNPEELDL